MVKQKTVSKSPAKPTPKPSPLSSLATKSLADVARELPDTPFGWKQGFPFPGVVLIMGDQGMGKTATAYWAMDQWRQASGSRTGGAIFQAPKNLKRLLPNWVKTPVEINQMPHNSVNILDEGQFYANSRRSSSNENLDIGVLIALARQRNQLNIVITHHSRKLDVNLVMEASRIIWKCPTHGHVLFERKELRPFAARALEYFQNLRGDVRRQAYVMDFKALRFGPMPTARPSWWNEVMSTAMAGYVRPTTGGDD